MAIDCTLEIYQGNTLVIPIELEDDDGVAIDLTGATIKFMLDTITETTSGYSIVRDDSNGGFTITIDDSLTELLDTHWYLFDIEITYASGVKTTQIHGLLKINENLIRISGS